MEVTSPNSQSAFTGKPFVVAKLLIHVWLCHPVDCSPGSTVHGVLQQEYWSGLPFPSPWDLPDPGIKPASPALASWLFPTEPLVGLCWLADWVGLNNSFLLGDSQVFTEDPWGSGSLSNGTALCRAFWKFVRVFVYWMRECSSGI